MIRTILIIAGIIALLIVLYIVYVYLASGQTPKNTLAQTFNGAIGAPSDKPSSPTPTGATTSTQTSVAKAGDILIALEAIPVYKSAGVDGNTTANPTLLLGDGNRLRSGLLSSFAYVPTGNKIGIYVKIIGDFIQIKSLPTWNETTVPNVYYILKSAKFNVQ